MSIVFDEEQQALRKSVRAFVEQRSPMSVVRKTLDTADGIDSGLWAGLAGDLGIVGLAVPERFGGAGYGHVEQAVVFEEFGRTLVCTPYFSTVALATNALLISEDEVACARYLPEISDGSITATIATTEDSGSWDLETVSTEAITQGEGFVLHGHKCFVIDGVSSDLILVLARSDAGLALFAVDTRTSEHRGMTRIGMTTLDQTRKMARLTFDGTPATLVGSISDGVSIVDRALDVAVSALAMEQVGGAQQCLDMSVEYAKVRTQFGRKIGSFQAVKHKCADMLVAVESARSAAYDAVYASVHEPDRLPVAAAMAKSVCSDAYNFCAAENIQIHGGIGFTWEHDAHLYYRRANSTALLFGDATYHRERLAQRLGVGR